MLKMGGLRKQMPFVCTVFVIGSLALAGLPILNGFWSKEAILEAGLHGGPGWAFAVMVFTAGLTAFTPSASSGWSFTASPAATCTGMTPPRPCGSPCPCWPPVP